jgi:uncharacterized membrane protein required for colicin V production
MSLFKLCSTLLSLIITARVYPIAAGLLKKSENLCDFLRQSIASTLGLDRLAADAGRGSAAGQAAVQSLKAQTEFINGLKLPEFFTDGLLTNNNSMLYEILDISRVEDYIVEFILNICLNIIAIILVFALVSLVLSLAAHVLNAAVKLPVISSFNKIGGMLFGAVKGAVVVWLCLAALSFFFYKPEFSYIFDMIEASSFAKFFYIHNILLNLIMKINT